MAKRDFETEFRHIMASEFPDGIDNWLEDGLPSAPSETEGSVEETMRKQRIINASKDERIMDYFDDAEASFDEEEKLMVALERDYGLESEAEAKEAIRIALDSFDDIVGYMDSDEREDYG